MDFGARLKALREEMGLSMGKLKQEKSLIEKRKSSKYFSFYMFFK